MILILGTNLARAKVELGSSWGRVKVDQSLNLRFFYPIMGCTSNKWIILSRWIMAPTEILN